MTEPIAPATDHHRELTVDRNHALLTKGARVKGHLLDLALWFTTERLTAAAQIKE